MGEGLSHIGPSGEARMVDVSNKQTTVREAVAEAFVAMSSHALSLITANPKGDVMATCRIAGIMAAKKTHELIPLCHPLPIDAIGVDLIQEDGGVRIQASVRTSGRTGVEMEAMTAVCIAALTLYDMCKAADRSITIGPVRLLSKSGGRSGDWKRG